MFVLVIDDEPCIRRVLVQSLEAAGFLVKQAICGRAGLAILEQLTPIGVVLDLNLPDMSGDEVLGEILRIDRELPVIVFSTYAEDPQVRSRLLEGGATACFAKSEVAMLVEELSRIAGGPGAMQPRNLNVCREPR